MKTKLIALCLMATSCAIEEQTEDQNEDQEFRASVWKNLDTVPTSVKKYTLTRPDYSDSTAESRATSLAEILMEDTSINISSELQTLVDNAQAGMATWLPHTETGNAWPNYGDGISFDYNAHTEKMTVYSPDIDPITDYTEDWDGDLDEGIGKAAALTEAQAVLTEMQTAGLISAGEISSAPFSQYPMVHHIYDSDRDQTLRIVDHWTFRFYSILDNIPVVDNFVEVRIGRGGTRMKISLQRVTKTFNSNVNTTISKTNAINTLITRAETYFGMSGDGWVHLDKTMPVYELRPEQTSALVTPSLTGRLVPVGPPIDDDPENGGPVGFSVKANLNFVSPESTLNVYSPWGGDRPTHEGSTCQRDSDCTGTGATVCYPSPSTCGECDEHSDCPTVASKPGRCQPPNPFSTDHGAECVNGALGAVCTANSDCSSNLCTTVLKDGALGTVKVCSNCTNDVACGGSTPECMPAYDWNTWRLYKACSVRNSRANGVLCDSNDDCTSNKCYLTNMGGLVGNGLGVCSACLTNANCSGGQVCDPPRFDQSGGTMTPATCVAP